MLTAFDIFAEAGKFTAHDEVFDGIEVTDGQLRIDIINRVSYVREIQTQFMWFDGPNEPDTRGSDLRGARETGEMLAPDKKL